MVKQYIGARYVPIFDGDYNAEKAYEPLTIVTYLNNSYTSKKTVPAGVLPSNTEYWALTGNYNAQVEEYRQTVENYKNEIDTYLEHISVVSPMDYGAIGDGIHDDSDALNEAASHGIIEDMNHTYYIESDLNLPYGMINTSILCDDNIGLNLSGKYFYNNEVYGNPSELDGTRGRYLLTIDGVDSVVIHGNIFRDSKNAIYLHNCNNAKIVNNTFFNLIQTAENIGGNGYGIVTALCDNMVISGNVFKDINRHCIYLSTENDERGSENIMISNNIFHYENVPTLSRYELPIQTRNAKNLNIDNNIFRKTNGIICVIAQVSGTDTKSDHIYVTNNKCYDIYNAQRLDVDGCIYFANAPGGTVEHVRFNRNYIRATQMPLAKLAGVTNISFEDNEYVSVNGTKAFIFEDADGNYNLMIRNNSITLSGADSNLIFTDSICTKIGRVNIIDNNLVLSHFIYIASAITRIGNFDFHGNVYTCDADRDYLNDAPINEVKCYKNVGNIHKWINGNATSIITTNDDNMISFASNSADIYAKAAPIPNSGGASTNSKYLPDIVFNHNNFTASTLPTTNVKFGQISTTSDGNAYIFNGTQWKIIT